MKHWFIGPSVIEALVYRSIGHWSTCYTYLYSFQKAKLLTGPGAWGGEREPKPAGLRGGPGDGGRTHHHPLDEDDVIRLQNPVQVVLILEMVTFYRILSVDSGFDSTDERRDNDRPANGQTEMNGLSYRLPKDNKFFDKQSL